MFCRYLRDTCDGRLPIGMLWQSYEKQPIKDVLLAYDDNAIFYTFIKKKVCNILYDM